MNTIIKLVTPIFMLAAFHAGASESKTQEKRFELTGKGQLLVENINGDVEISAWSENSVLVSARLQAKDSDDLQNISVVMKQNGNRITVETEFKDKGWGSRNQSGSVDYTINVPATMDLREIELVNGSLKVDNVSGLIDADVVNGSVVATGLANDVEIESVNGKVEISMADTTKDARINIESVNGPITLSLAESFDAKIDASSGNGGINNDFGLEVIKGEYWGSELDAQIGDGNNRITLETVNGAISIVKK
ncbi:DUF4097 family beta strand repeat-containing protein [Thalassotalea ponticola]|uniref:DUF4097 family beta strand repeat-containing protein n=1 Tax=Thalassotalea ponticola TaxID=1523392 RepID=UPI0025B529E9|nr:DUF4097 family beta strand repeat-containing protein [Thalassotalea ponticola]MDN3652028.1 DUF4097 family beta strand repeat-containing protein [Thalassotalea ponticola]